MFYLECDKLKDTGAISLSHTIGIQKAATADSDFSAAVELQRWRRGQPTDRPDGCIIKLMHVLTAS